MRVLPLPHVFKTHQRPQQATGSGPATQSNSSPTELMQLDRRRPAIWVPDSVYMISTAMPGSSGGGIARSSSCCSRSEEHTSELQSRLHLVCRLLLEKKKK